MLHLVPTLAFYKSNMHKILIVHTRYLQHGGEDTVFEHETTLLQKKFEVDTLVFSNKELQFPAFLWEVFNNRESEKRLMEKIDQFQPDVIHLHNFFYKLSPAIFQVCTKLCIPLVMTIHNYRLLCPSGLLTRNQQPCTLCVNKTFSSPAIRHKCFKNSALKSAHLASMLAYHHENSTFTKGVSKFIFLTPFAKATFLNSHMDISESQAVVKPNFIPDFGLSELNKRNNALLFIGRLSEEKGIPTLLKAMPNIHQPVEIIGDGPLREEVIAASLKYPMLKYHGFQDKDFIAAKLKSCSALLFLSEWYEGLPMTIIEAFSTGTPIICSNIENVRDLVQHGHNGFHFQWGNPKDLAKIIKEYTITEQLIQQARKTYQENYTPEQNLKLLSSIYDSLIKTPVN
ncbi:hypothetical protein PEPS_39430 (plasmid) [Persicobacter psychrovividus]|uniref:Glycosyl transferase family 1 domain-containing protein n=2 Tax=Persicobacter psychrovividus TaxID=387638 RepID=A0ABM7VKZ3_9BACT|nr:hypothetical protein PEPS_39430 [Persicobacter psychrovividus]